jgi:Spy/CpxP family protein refolding chaperone
MLTNELNLTPQQQQTATTIMTNMISGADQFHANMKAAHEALQTAVKNNDTAGIDSAATTVGNLTAQMIAAHAKADAAIYQTLTPDQQAKFLQLETEHARGMMDHMHHP